MNFKEKQSLVARLLAKGEAFCASGEHKEAIKVFDKILKINPKNVRALNDKGFTLSKLGNNQEAIKMYKRVLEIYPNNTTYLNNKAYSLTKLGKYREAINVCNEILSRDPKNIRALDIKRFSLHKQGKSTWEEIESEDLEEYYDKMHDIAWEAFFKEIDHMEGKEEDEGTRDVDDYEYKQDMILEYSGDSTFDEEQEI